MPTDAFRHEVEQRIAATPVLDRLRERPAIVLERIARGGGATRWYDCADPSSLAAVQRCLRPGSVASFYFDRRLRTSRVATELQDFVRSAIRSDGECVVGWLGNRAIEFEVDFVSSPAEWAVFLSGAPPQSLFLACRFPAIDNDGEHAVAITLPDADGVVRAHPH